MPYGVAIHLCALVAALGAGPIIAWKITRFVKWVRGTK